MSGQYQNNCFVLTKSMCFPVSGGRSHGTHHAAAAEPEGRPASGQLRGPHRALAGRAADHRSAAAVLGRRGRRAHAHPEGVHPLDALSLGMLCLYWLIHISACQYGDVVLCRQARRPTAARLIRTMSRATRRRFCGWRAASRTRRCPTHAFLSAKRGSARLRISLLQP